MPFSNNRTSPDTRTLFLAWQDDDSRQWYTVGRLDQAGDRYRYRYTQGALMGQEEAGFTGVISFPHLRETYESHEIFPLFANQVLSERRPEYADYIQWLALPEDEADPVAILARTSERVSETLEIYPQPKVSDGTYELHFFVRGVRHMSTAAQQRMQALTVGERLCPALDVQNEHDPGAWLLRTDEQTKGDLHIVGYVPRYLSSELRRVDPAGLRDVRIEVARVNPTPTPVHFRLLCRLTMDTALLQPFQSRQHQPLGEA